MEIFGYSERGVMNALFYGIAYKSTNKKKNIDTLLSLAGLGQNLCDDYDIIMEASLSDFGDPDAIIIGKDIDGNDTNIYFIEGKVSAGKNYSLTKEKSHFDNAMANNNAFKGFTSSLFGQLTLKYQLINNNTGLPKIITSKNNRNGQPVPRTYGDNPIVGKIINRIKSCGNQYYIAITPDTDIKLSIAYNNVTLFEVNCINWSRVKNNQDLGQYITDALTFNKGTKNGKPYDQINNK